ncbi:MAG: hypothetical protein ABSF28_17285 [Terracidiphilus sp.]|jgi:hypothetical protein
MVRFITTPESTYIGRCIYCDATQGKLTDEHVSPFGLNGCLILSKASCLDCNKVTSALEFHVLRGMWGTARTEMGYQTRNEKGADDLYPITVIRSGVKTVQKVPLKDALKTIELPIFRPPAVLEGRVATRIDSISKDQFDLDEQRTDLARRLGVEEMCSPYCDPSRFTRFVAKCSLGYAIERYGFEAFESIYVRSAILGKTEDIGQWVGSPDTREFPVRNTPMSGGFKILPDNDVLVRIKLFPRFDGAEYITVVGKMKEIHADQYRLVKAGREAPRAESA